MCKFTSDYKNKEGFLKTEKGTLICLDWDVRCNECSGEIFIFGINEKAIEESEWLLKK